MFRGSDLPDMKWLGFFFMVGFITTIIAVPVAIIWIAKVFIFYFTHGDSHD